jgi:hypothetical protein
MWSNATEEPANMKPNHLHVILLAIILTMALVIGVGEFYWLRELLVALLIFTLVSAVVWIVVLTVYFLQQAARKGSTNFERSLAYLRTRVAATSAQAHTHPK